MKKSLAHHAAHPDPDKDTQDRRPAARRMVSILAGGCADCGASGLDHELYPVPDDHLTFFSGDELCGECAGKHV